RRTRSFASTLIRRISTSTSSKTTPKTSCCPCHRAGVEDTRRSSDALGQLWLKTLRGGGQRRSRPARDRRCNQEIVQSYSFERFRLLPLATSLIGMPSALATPSP